MIFIILIKLEIFLPKRLQLGSRSNRVLHFRQHDDKTDFALMLELYTEEVAKFREQVSAGNNIEIGPFSIPRAALVTAGNYSDESNRDTLDIGIRSVIKPIKTPGFRDMYYPDFIFHPNGQPMTPSNRSGVKIDGWSEIRPSFKSLKNSYKFPNVFAVIRITVDNKDLKKWIKQ